MMFPNDAPRGAHPNLGKTPPATAAVYENAMPDKRRLKAGLADAEIIQRELKITNFIVDRPFVVLGVCGVVTLVITVICMTALLFEIAQVELVDRDDYRTERSHAVELTEDLIDDMPEGVPGVVDENKPKQPLRTTNLDSFSFVFKHGTNVFTLEALRFMKKLEEKITFDKKFVDYCVLNWIPATAQCPGADCQWYTPQWDFTAGNVMADGSQLICDTPMMSLTWLMYNKRIAIRDETTTPPSWNECDVVGAMQHCIDNGDLAYISELSGATFGVQTPPEGVEPTQAQLDAFIRIFARLRKLPRYSWLTPFFHKNFDNEALPTTDPARYYSQATRSTVAFGGPISKVEHSKIAKPCQTLMNEGDCNGVTGCKWGGYAGYNRDLVGCSYDQYLEVARGDNDDDTKDQRTDVADFTKDFASYYDDVSGPVEVLYFSQGIIGELFNEILMRDALLAMASFAFVYFYLQVHTQSFMLATLGMIQVIMPFPLAYFIYRGILQVKGFYGLSVLTVFIVLAIGADDIFVFMDAWVHVNEKPRHDSAVYMKGRMARAWKSAGKAMAVTSATTMAAFIATMTTPLMEIAAFGLFAALLVLFDYILVMTFFAAAIVVYHRRYENTLGCCCCGSTMLGGFCDCCTCYTTLVSSVDNVGCLQSRRTRPRTYESIEEAREQLGSKLDHSPRNKTLNGDDMTAVPSGNMGADPKTDPEYKKSYFISLGLFVVSAVVYFIGFFSLLSDRDSSSGAFMKWIVLIVLGLVLFTAAMTAWNRAQSIKIEKGFSDGTDTFMRATVAPFLSGTDGRPVFVRFIPGLILVSVWVFLIINAFQLHPTTKNDQWLPDWHSLQRYMDSMSEDFPSNNQDEVQSVQVTFGFANSPIDRSGTDKWDPDDKGKPVFNPNADFNSAGFQEWGVAFCDKVLEESVKDGVSLQRMLFGANDQNCVFRGLKDHVGTAGWPVTDLTVSLWDLYKNQSMSKQVAPDAFTPYNDFTDTVLFDFGNGGTSPPTGIKAVILHFNTTLPMWGSSHDAIKEWFDDWNTFMDGEKPTSAVPMVHSSAVFIWMHTQALLVKGAVNGTIISLCLAGVIVFIASMNILIAFLVVLELCGVAGTVLGIVELMGWELGMIESVSITILVGLSVDYVVHFAIHYTHVKLNANDEIVLEGYSQRKQRVNKTIQEMGGTVLGGAATSIGASMILFCTWVQFFYKFGVVFMLTVVFSYTWATLFFLPLMSLIGPENDFLSIRPLLAKALPRFFGPSSHTHTPAASVESSEPLPDRSENVNSIQYNHMGQAPSANPLYQLNQPAPLPMSGSI